MTVVGCLRFRCKYDESTGQYVPVSTGAEVGSSAVNTAGQGALAAAETALVSARQGSGGSAGALGVQAQRRKSATIGSAPQYNPQGLLEMAALLSVSAVAPKPQLSWS
jgi:hypothetical protein